MSKESDDLINQLSKVIVNLEKLSEIDSQILANHRQALRLLISSDNGLDQKTVARIKEIACLTEDGFVDAVKIKGRF